MSFRFFDGGEYRVCDGCAARKLVPPGYSGTSGAPGWLYILRVSVPLAQYLHFCAKCKHRAPKCLAARRMIADGAGRLV